jgi:hypothetical protein
MVYPVMAGDGDLLRPTLVKENIYIANYWLNVLIKCLVGSFQDNLTKILITLQCDQRYDIDDMQKILGCLNA